MMLSWRHRMPLSASFAPIDVHRLFVEEGGTDVSMRVKLIE